MLTNVCLDIQEIVNSNVAKIKLKELVKQSYLEVEVTLEAVAVFKFKIYGRVVV